MTGIIATDSLSGLSFPQQAPYPQPEGLLQVGGTSSLNSPVTSPVTWNESGTPGRGPQSRQDAAPRNTPRPTFTPSGSATLPFFASPETQQASASPGRWLVFLLEEMPLSQLSVWFTSLPLSTPELSIIGSPAPTLPGTALPLIPPPSLWLTNRVPLCLLSASPTSALKRQLHEGEGFCFSLCSQ